MSCTDECRWLRHGSRFAHCSVCHSTFTGVTAFDRHRVGGVCVLKPPLSEKDGVWGQWDRPRQDWWT